MKTLIFLIVLIPTISFSQKIKVVLKDQPDIMVYLLKYHGKNLYYSDSTQIKNGVAEFDGSKQKPGLLVFYIGKDVFFEMLYDNEEVHMESKGPDFISNMNVIKSDNNRVFYDYMRFLKVKRTESDAIVKQMSDLKKEEPVYKELTSKNELVSSDVKAYQSNLISQNSSKFVSKIVKMGMEIEIPKAPTNLDGSVVDSLFQYHYLRDHYFDNVDFTLDGLVNSPVFHNKVETFFGPTMMYQNADSIVKYAFLLCDKLAPKSKAFEYCVSWITSHYETSNIMGLENVFVLMSDRYYCTLNAEGKSNASWMSDEKLKDFCESIGYKKKVLFGMVPPDITLRDTSDTKWLDYYSIKAEYTILYFWEATCGHCKTKTPQLQNLYANKFKARGIEVFAVSNAIGDEFELWKKFIRENKLTFRNVALTSTLYRDAKENPFQFIPKYTNEQSLNYSKHFDTALTPTIYVLDKNKKIIGKKLSIAQLEDFLDKMQHQEASPKLYPLEDEKADEETKH